MTPDCLIWHHTISCLNRQPLNSDACTRAVRHGSDARKPIGAPSMIPDCLIWQLPISCLIRQPLNSEACIRAVRHGDCAHLRQCDALLATLDAC